MKARPLSVTIIAWVLIVLGVIGLAGLALTSNSQLALSIMSQSPMSLQMQMIVGAISAVVSVACGVAILKGKDWGRTVYVVVGALGIVITLVTTPTVSGIALNVAVLAVIAFFLFRAPANEFFGKTYFGGTSVARD